MKRLRITVKLDQQTHRQLQSILDETGTSLDTFTETLLTAAAQAVNTLGRLHGQYETLSEKEAWQVQLIEAFDIYQLYTVQLIQPILEKLRAAGHYTLDDVHLQPVDEGCGYALVFAALTGTPYLVDEFILEVPGCDTVPHLIAFHFLGEELERLHEEERDAVLEKLANCIYNYGEDCPDTENLPLNGEDEYLELNEDTLEYHSENWLESMPQYPR